MLSLSGIAPAMLLLSAALVAYLGAEYFRLHPVPDYIGSASTTYSGSTLCFSISGVASLFFMLAFVGWYRAAQLDTEAADAVAANWAGTIFVLVGIPYLIFGALYHDALGGRLLLWGSILAIAVGAVCFASPFLWKKERQLTPVPPSTR